MATSYEVTDGTRIIGTFSSQSKADALKKELKAQGVKARVRIVHEDPKAKKTEKAPKKPVKAKKATKSIPVPKKTAKAPQKPKEAPKTGKGGNADNVPKDYKGPLMSKEDILRMFEDRVCCTDFDTGGTSIILIKYGTVSVMEAGADHRLKAVYPNAKLESDGNCLRVTYKGADHWFIIEGPEREKVDYSVCTIDQLADVLYEIQEVHLSHRMWYDIEEPRVANPVWTRDGILEAIQWDPEKAVDLCDVFLHCFITTRSEYWEGWDEDSISYADWKAIERRLIRIMDMSVREIEANKAKTTPAPVVKPKRGSSKKKTKTKLEARADLYKRLGRILSDFGRPNIPVSRAEFNLRSFSKSGVIQFKSTDGMSFFGLPDEPGSTKAIQLTSVAKHINLYFDDDGNPKPEWLMEDADSEYHESSRMTLKSYNYYRVDSNDFRTALNRASKVVGKGLFRRTAEDYLGSGALCLYDDGYGNLMIRSESASKGKDGRPQFGTISDVGDGRDLTGQTYYRADDLFILADLMSLSEGGTCGIWLGENYPLSAKLRFGGFDVEMIIPPCEMED